MTLYITNIDWDFKNKTDIILPEKYEIDLPEDYNYEATIDYYKDIAQFLYEEFGYAVNSMSIFTTEEYVKECAREYIEGIKKADPVAFYKMTEKEYKELAESVLDRFKKQYLFEKTA